MDIKSVMMSSKEDHVMITLEWTGREFIVRKSNDNYDSTPPSPRYQSIEAAMTFFWNDVRDFKIDGFSIVAFA